MGAGVDKRPKETRKGGVMSGLSNMTLLNAQQHAYMQERYGYELIFTHDLNVRQMKFYQRKRRQHFKFTKAIGKRLVELETKARGK